MKYARVYLAIVTLALISTVQAQFVENPYQTSSAWQGEAGAPSTTVPITPSYVGTNAPDNSPQNVVPTGNGGYYNVNTNTSIQPSGNGGYIISGGSSQ